MFALKQLTASLKPRIGQHRLPPGRNGPSTRRWGRASYLFNPTIEGIEQSDDPLLIIGSKFPASRLSVLNAPHPQALAH